MQPRIFIASSTESLEVPEAIQQNLDYIAEVTIWTQAVFTLSDYNLESLKKEISESDFGIFILNADDTSIIRGKSQPTTRQNVIMELGMAISILGRERVFIIKPRGVDIHIPSDLHGVVIADYNPLRRDRNIVAALGVACSQIKKQVEKLGIKKEESTEFNKNSDGMSEMKENMSEVNNSDAKNQNKNTQSNEIGATSCAHLFNKYFIRAFPGLRREYKWYTEQPVIHNRLLRMLQSPLHSAFQGEPFWWFRGHSNNGLRLLRISDDKELLLLETAGEVWELKINRIAAVDIGGYWNCFLYVETTPLTPSGVSSYTEADIRESIDEYGYAREVVGYYQGQYIRPEYVDDGVAEIDGQLIDLIEDEAEIRVRFLSPYNFVIAAFDSSINYFLGENRIEFERNFEKIMNGILQQTNSLEELIEEFKVLPKRVMYWGEEPDPKKKKRRRKSKKATD